MKTKKHLFKLKWHSFWITWHDTKYHYYGSRWHEKRKFKHEQKVTALYSENDHSNIELITEDKDTQFAPSEPAASFEEASEPVQTK